MSNKEKYPLEFDNLFRAFMLGNDSHIKTVNRMINRIRDLEAAETESREKLDIALEALKFIAQGKHDFLCYIREAQEAITKLEGK